MGIKAAHHGRSARVVFVLVMTIGLNLPHTSAAAEAPAPDCADSRGTEIPASVIGLPTKGGEVTAAELVPGSGSGVEAIGEHCLLDAAISPVDESAFDIELRVAIPTEWNQRVFMFGGGGYDGTIPDLEAPLAFGSGNLDTKSPLGRGYATFGSDSGHQADPDFEPAPSLDGSFGANDEAVRNFTGDALKKTRDAALYLIAAHRPMSQVEKSYFAGNSSGGREALAVTQRWPYDFDGVVSTAPAWNAASLNLFFGHQARVMAQPGAFLHADEQEALHEAVLASCDEDDGLRDRVISDEEGCDFDVAEIRCPAGNDTGKDCLSDAQIQAVESISRPLQWEHELDSGETGYPGFPYLSGADMTTPLLGMGTQQPNHPMPTDSGYGAQFWDQWVKYFVTRDEQHNSLTLDPLDPGDWQPRISALAATQDVNDPDLRPFAASGGKLVLLHGTADELVSHRSTAEYYDRMRHTMGEAAVRDFARFYQVPGANHGPSEAEFMPAWDVVDALDRWATENEAPTQPVVRDTGTATERSRPLCHYPAWPKYLGGAPEDATSFECHH